MRAICTQYSLTIVHSTLLLLYTVLSYTVHNTLLYCTQYYLTIVHSTILLLYTVLSYYCTQYSLTLYAVLSYTVHSTLLHCTQYSLILYTVLSYLGVFTFCACCILICLACIVASFKLSSM